MELEAVVNGHKKKTGDKLGETLRFDLELASPTEESTNEFSYERLLAKKRKKVSFEAHLGSFSNVMVPSMCSINAEYGLTKIWYSRVSLPLSR